MLHSAWQIAANSVGDLLDAALDESLQIEILRCLVLHFDDYEHLHRIRTRRSGPRIYIELSLGFDDRLVMSDVMARIERIRESVAAAIVGADITIVPSRGDLQAA